MLKYNESWTNQTAIPPITYWRKYIYTQEYDLHHWSGNRPTCSPPTVADLGNGYASAGRTTDNAFLRRPEPEARESIGSNLCTHFHPSVGEVCRMNRAYSATRVHWCCSPRRHHRVLIAGPRTLRRTGASSGDHNEVVVRSNVDLEVLNGRRPFL